MENRDPREVFRQVFHVPAPKGVLYIKVAGYQPFNGNLWMLVRTTDIDTLLKGIGACSKSTIGEPLNRSDMKSYEPQSSDDRGYAAAAGWELAHHVKRPEYYTFPRENTGTGWVGFLVVDREGHRVFVSAIVL